MNNNTGFDHLIATVTAVGHGIVKGIFFIAIAAVVFLICRAYYRHKQLKMLPTPLAKDLLRACKYGKTCLNQRFEALSWIHIQTQHYTAEDGTVKTKTIIHRPTITRRYLSSTGYVFILSIPPACGKAAFQHTPEMIANILGEPLNVVFTPSGVKLTLGINDPLLGMVELP